MLGYCVIDGQKSTGRNKFNIATFNPNQVKKSHVVHYAELYGYDDFQWDWYK